MTCLSRYLARLRSRHNLQGVKMRLAQPGGPPQSWIPNPQFRMVKRCQFMVLPLIRSDSKRLFNAEQSSVLIGDGSADGALLGNRASD